MSTEYASKGVAGAGLGLGIAGTALGLLGAHGGLAGLFGGNVGQTYTDQLQAKIAELQAKQYSDAVGIEVYKAAAERDAKIGTRFEELAREIADMRVREAQTQGQINTVAMTAQQGIATNAMGLAALKATVDKITVLHVPATAVCPEPMSKYNSWTAPTA